MRKTILGLGLFSISCMLNSVAFADLNQFVGKWKNVDPESGGITRFEITQSGEELNVHVWGSCSPKECDWGQATLTGYSPFSSDPNSSDNSVSALTATFKSAWTHYTDVLVIKPISGNRSMRLDRQLMQVTDYEQRTKFDGNFAEAVFLKQS